MKKVIKTEEEMTIKVNLSVFERIHFAELLPRSGSRSEMSLAETLTKRVGFTAQEIEEFKIVALSEKRVGWSAEKAKLREFRFETFEILFIQQGAKYLDDSKQLTADNYKLADRLLAIAVKTKEEK